MNKVLLSILALNFVACSGNRPSSEVDNEYFGLRKLIENQIAILSSGNYNLKKSAVLNELEDSKTFAPDSLGWSDELKLFRDADINVPSLRGVYEEVDGPGEIGSNLKEVNYLPITKVKIGVQYLKVFFVDEMTDPRKIEIKVSETNPLFHSETILTLELLRDGNDNLVLNNYEIIGGQKMILMDSVSYRISGQIVN